MWQSVVKGPVTPAIAELLRGEGGGAAAAGAMECRDLERLDQRGEDRTGRKGKELFMPLRLALTASDHGPELKLLLPLIGRDRALKRLKGETA